MGLSTYQELRNAVLAWPDLGTEEDLEAIVDTCISLGEDRVYRVVRSRWSLGSAFGVFSDEPGSSVDLPSDFVAVDWVRGPSGEALEQRPADEVFRWGYPPSGPAIYALDGNKILFSPAVANYSLQYFRRQPPLIEGGNNDLFSNASAIFLYSALIEAAIFSKEPDQEASRYTASFEKAVAELMANEGAYKLPASQPIRTKVGRYGLKQRSG